MAMIRPFIARLKPPRAGPQTTQNTVIGIQKMQMGEIWAARRASDTPYYTLGLQESEPPCRLCCRRESLVNGRLGHGPPAHVAMLRASARVCFLDSGASKLGKGGVHAGKADCLLILRVHSTKMRSPTRGALLTPFPPPLSSAPRPTLNEYKHAQRSMQ